MLGSGLNLMAALQNTPRAADIELPPITWACPMNGVVMADGTTHADVYEAGKGNCPICRMALAAVRLDSIWTCPVHSVIAEKQGGKCPIDRRDLVQVTVGVSWTCAGRPEINDLTPGKCPDGSAMAVKYHAAGARQSQPSAWRPVLHGPRQLAPPRGHSRERGCRTDLLVRRLHQTAAARSNEAGPGPDHFESRARAKSPIRWLNCATGNTWRPKSTAARCRSRSLQSSS